MRGYILYARLHELLQIIMHYYSGQIIQNDVGIIIDSVSLKILNHKYGDLCVSGFISVFFGAHDASKQNARANDQFFGL